MSRFSTQQPGDSTRDLFISQLEVTYNLLEGHVNSPSQKGYQQNCQEGGGCNLFSAFFFTWGGSTACSPICSLIDRGPP